MVQKKRLPDTPWHIGFTKKEEDDPRRHKARCVFLFGNVCKNGHSGCFQLKCGGSAHCSFYAESMISWQEVWKRVRSIAQEKEENQQENHDRAKILQSRRMNDASGKLNEDRKQFLERSFSGTRFCLICNTKLVGKDPVKICPYCRAVYVKEGSKFDDDPSSFVLKSDARDVKYLGKTVVMNLDGRKVVLQQDVVPVTKGEGRKEENTRDRKFTPAMLNALSQVRVNAAGFSSGTVGILEKEKIRTLGTLARMAESGTLKKIKGLKNGGLIEILDRLQTKTGVSFHDEYLGKEDY